MDILQTFSKSEWKPIQTIDMHTTGEPTRIVVGGCPDLSSHTLLEQRAEAQRDHDNIRKRLILEPRGHFDMYGAILRPETELTRMNEAHMGVLFLTNDGYSTMCGHATIALGRFLFDTHDRELFPARETIKYDSIANTAILKLHVPCGLLEVTVPTLQDGSRSDPERPVSFLSVPSFATGIQVKVAIPKDHRWPELGGRDHVITDFSYGGAFFCIIPAVELGFPAGLSDIDFDAMNRATKLLKATINANPDLRHLFQHPELDDVSFLYSIIVVDQTMGKSNGKSGSETGLCYFADQEVDRSPTGSGVAARAALAYAKGDLTLGVPWEYHSLVSNATDGKGGFSGTVVEEVGIQKAFPLVHVKVEGFAYYTGSSTFVVEKDDPLDDGGFVFEKL